MADFRYFRQLTITLPGLQFTKGTTKAEVSRHHRKKTLALAKAPLALGPIEKRGRKGEKQ
jgi:hypothetical protein